MAGEPKAKEEQWHAETTENKMPLASKLSKQYQIFQWFNDFIKWGLIGLMN